MRAVVICPGRGTYGPKELGYLGRRLGTGGQKAGWLPHTARPEEPVREVETVSREARSFLRANGVGWGRPTCDLVTMFDSRRDPTVSTLDGASSFDPALHQRGDNASPLIFACSYADFVAIDREAVEIVAVTGNSMGWYTALVCAAALTPERGFDLVAFMGALMHEQGVGGQAIQTTLDADWRPLPGKREALLAAHPGLHVSIELGGMIVFAGEEAALAALPVGPAPFPMRLQYHAAFHSPLMASIAEAARATLPPDWLGDPTLPMIDGRGHIWRPNMVDPQALRDYTLGHQITRTYDFTRAVQVAVKEFAPDCLIVLGPGGTLGGAVIQSLLAIGWRGWTSKSEYLAGQEGAGFVRAIGGASPPDASAPNIAILAG